MPPKTRVLVVSAGVAVAVAVAVVVVAVRGDVAARMTASTGSDVSALLDMSDRRVSWRTEGEPVGDWVELTYSEATTVDRVGLLGAGGAAEPPAGALLTFDGDAALLVTPDQAGDAIVEFPERTVSRARMTVASVPDGAESVALAAFPLDDEAGDAPERDVRQEVIGVTSDDAGSPTTRLTDGVPADGDTGEEWVAAEDDRAPWAALSWDSPREIASVQVLGPSGDRRDGEEPLSGVFSFDDGSSVPVASIATGDDKATTVACALRTATEVRLDLERLAGGGVVGLRELAVYDVGTTPPRWSQAGNGYASTAPDAECGARTVRAIGGSPPHGPDSSPTLSAERLISHLLGVGRTQFPASTRDPLHLSAARSGVARGLMPRVAARDR